MLSETTGGTKHCDVQPAEIIKSESCVGSVQEAVESFENPFATGASGKLLILFSGATASVDVEKDVLQAETLSKKAKDNFITSCLKTGDNSSEPIKHLNMKTLGSMSKKGNEKSLNKQVVQYTQ